MKAHRTTEMRAKVRKHKWTQGEADPRAAGGGGWGHRSGLCNWEGTKPEPAEWHTILTLVFPYPHPMPRLDALTE